MTTFPVLSAWLGEELLEVAKAMADGSYWSEGRSWENEIPDPPYYAPEIGGEGGGV